MYLRISSAVRGARLKNVLKLLCQGSLAKITNQKFSLKYQTFRQLAAAFISGSGLQSVHVLNVLG